MTVTDAQLRELFARHCECRPLDLTRTADDHAPIHDCDTGILHDVQVALGIIRFDDIGRIQVMREARARCAEYLALVPNDQGGYTTASESSMIKPPIKSDEPQDRLTRIGSTMLASFNAHDEKRHADRAIVFLKDETKGGIALAGYDDDKEALMDLMVHLRAMFCTHGLDLHFVPVGTTLPKDRA